ncbi:hypothetical protein, partial [Staphylococcus aureus]
MVLVPHRSAELRGHGDVVKQWGELMGNNRAVRLHMHLAPVILQPDEQRPKPGAACVHQRLPTSE